MNNIKGDEVRHGQRIYLDAVSKDRIASLGDELLSDVMMLRLHDTNAPLQPIFMKRVVETIKAQGDLVFALCLQEDKSCIGVCRLGDIDWKSRHAQLTIGIVKEEYYTGDMLVDVIQTVLQFAYWEANLNRIYIHLAEDNTVLQDALNHTNFTNEGRLRQEIYRNGIYLDKLIYSILQRDWSE